MKRAYYFVWPLLFGSLWGLSEVTAGEALYNLDVFRASVWLSVWAFFLLATARGLTNTPGTSTAIGGIAALFRLANTSPYFCHLLGIFLLGVAFDVAATIFLRKERPFSLQNSLAGVTGAFAGHALFALTVTYIIRYEFWASAGLPKVLDHIFINGSLVALASLILVPLGYWIGRSGEVIFRRSPRWALTGALLTTIAIWILG